ncbi:hypothetical protein LLH23_20795 [bacterium]|nr:hypothetical protein [bacterium]
MRHCLAVLMLATSGVLAAGPGAIAPLGQASLQLPRGDLCGLDVYDGRARAGVKLVPDGQAWRSADGALSLSLTAQPLKDRTNWFVKLTNNGSENAWLLLRAYRAFRPSGANWKYFNGNFSATPRQPAVRGLLPYTMPVVAAYDEAAGSGLGIEPLQIFSYLENGIIPPGRLEAGAPTAFYYGVKLVVDPGRTETVQFVTFGFDARGGERAAVAAFQALYPAAFAPIPGGDPRLQTAGEAGSAATWYKPSPEAIRRSMTRCDWCYAPVKIPGDWFGRPQFWDRYNEDVTDEKRLKEYYGTLDHYHAFLKETFDRVSVDHGVAPYFYIINWAYYRLAEDEYRDAMVNDPQAQNRIGPWVTNKGPDHRLFLWGNKAAAQFQQDLRDLWAAYPLSGFGHDVTMGGVKYRGPAVAASPGRAWDDEGEYCDVSVCIAKTADFIHSLPPKQFRAGFWGNGAEHIYSIAVRSDAGSFEGARYELPGLDSISRYRRYMLGSKAIQLFSGDSRDHTADYYDEENTPPEDIKLMYRRIQIGAMQACLKWGALPCSDLSAGWQESWELHELADRELYPYPWQLKCAATAEGPVDVAQYGTGTNARFAVMNPRGVEAAATLRVATPALYATADGAPTANTLQGGRLAISLKLPPAGTVVLVPVATRAAGVTAGTWRASRVQDETDGVRVTLSATQGLRPVLPPGYGVCADSPWHFGPKVFAATEKALVGFFDGVLPPGPSLKGGGKGNGSGHDLPAIVVRADAALMERKSGEAVQEYFRFYSEEVLQQPRVVLPIVAEPTAGKLVRFATASAPAIGLNGETLVIAAPEGQLLDTTRELLRLLDRKYPFYGQIGRWVHKRPIETELRKKLGLAGGTVLRDGTVLTTPLTAALFHPTAKGPAYGMSW